MPFLHAFSVIERGQLGIKSAGSFGGQVAWRFEPPRARFGHPLAMRRAEARFLHAGNEAGVAAELLGRREVMAGQRRRQGRGALAPDAIQAFQGTKLRYGANPDGIQFIILSHDTALRSVARSVRQSRTPIAREVDCSETQIETDLVLTILPRE